MTATEQQEFAKAATEFHRAIISRMRDLNPAGQHHRQLSSLSDEIIKSIEEITGEKPVWMRIAPSR